MRRFEIPDLPDLSVAKERDPSTFDGNAQDHVSLWFWLYIDRLTESDWDQLATSDALDWVIMPLGGQP